MSYIDLSVNDWQSPSENIAHGRLRNLYVAETPGSPDGKTRIGRPTIRTLTTVGSGPARGVWRQEGTFNGDILVVSGTSLYRVTLPSTVTLVGSLPGSDLVQFAGGGTRVLIVSAGTAYSTDGATVTSVAMPDGRPVKSVAYINSYFLLSQQDTDRFYWIAPGDTVPDPLFFATAERLPDPIETITIISDEVWFIGRSSVEVWAPTGQAALPFQRITGRAYSDGCADRNTLVLANTKTAYSGVVPAAIWVTDVRSVIMARGLISRISNESIEERLKTATNLRAWGCRHNRHDFYILTSDQFTLVYDLFMESWSVWDSYLLPNFKADLGVQSGSTPYGVNTGSNNLYILEEGNDDDGDMVIRQISGKIDVSGPSTPCNSITLKINTGWSPTYGYIPAVELRWSDDQGETFGRWRALPLGDKGQYSKEVTFRSMGSMNRVGRVIEIRFAASGRFRIDYAALNEAFS